MKILFLFALLLLQNPLACNEAIEQEPTVVAQDSLQVAGIPQVATTSLVFRSADGGKSWDNISEGLPEKVSNISCFADESGLYMLAGNELYRSTPKASAPFWTQEIVPDPQCTIAPGKNGHVCVQLRWPGLPKNPWYAGMDTGLQYVRE